MLGLKDVPLEFRVLDLIAAKVEKLRGGNARQKYERYEKRKKFSVHRGPVKRQADTAAICTSGGRGTVLYFGDGAPCLSALRIDSNRRTTA